MDEIIAAARLWIRASVDGSLAQIKVLADKRVRSTEGKHAAHNTV